MVTDEDGAYQDYLDKEYQKWYDVEYDKGYSAGKAGYAMSDLENEAFVDGWHDAFSC